MAGQGTGPSRRSHTKSRKGCKTCKRRHIRCDETFPQWSVFCSGSIGCQLTLTTAVIAPSTKFVATIWRPSGRIPMVSKVPNNLHWSSHPRPRVESINGNKRGAFPILAYRCFLRRRHTSTPKLNFASCITCLRSQTTSCRKEHPTIRCGRKRCQNFSASHPRIHTLCMPYSHSPQTISLGVSLRTT